MFKRIAFIVIIISIFLSLTGCSPSTNAINNTTKEIVLSENGEISVDNAETNVTEETNETQTTSDASSNNGDVVSETFSPYTYENHKISISFPTDWFAPSVVDDEDGLAVTASSDDYAALIYLFVKEIDPEVPTLEHYKKETIAMYESLFESAPITEEIIELKGIEFLKISIKNPETNVHQFIYAAYANDCFYEITISSEAAKYSIYKSIFKKIERSIQIVEEDSIEENL